MILISTHMLTFRQRSTVRPDKLSRYVLVKVCDSLRLSPPASARSGLGSDIDAFAKYLKEIMWVDGTVNARCIYGKRRKT